MRARTGRVVDPSKLWDILAERLWSLSELSRKSGVSYRTLKYAVATEPRVLTLGNAMLIEQALDVPADNWSTKVGPNTEPAAA